MNNTAWGALMLAYLVPWVIWAVRVEDVPGKDYDKRTKWIGFSFAAGMALLMLGWWLSRG
jgi:hypothetical protein